MSDELRMATGFQWDIDAMETIFSEISYAAEHAAVEDNDRLWFFSDVADAILAHLAHMEIPELANIHDSCDRWRSIALLALGRYYILRGWAPDEPANQFSVDVPKWMAEDIESRADAPLAPPSSAEIERFMDNAHVDWVFRQPISYIDESGNEHHWKNMGAWAEDFKIRLRGVIDFPGAVYEILERNLLDKAVNSSSTLMDYDIHLHLWTDPDGRQAEMLNRVDFDTWANWVVDGRIDVTRMAYIGQARADYLTSRLARYLRRKQHG